jgi:hypothetical protein
LQVGLSGTSFLNKHPMHAHHSTLFVHTCLFTHTCLHTCTEL